MPAILFNERVDSFNKIRCAQQIVCGVTCYTKKRFYADSCWCFLSHISFSTLNIDARKINDGLTED